MRINNVVIIKEYAKNIWSITKMHCIIKTRHRISVCIDIIIFN